jgi:hypothetical protein
MSAASMQANAIDASEYTYEGAFKICGGILAAPMTNDAEKSRAAEGVPCEGWEKLEKL